MIEQGTKQFEWPSIRFSTSESPITADWIFRLLAEGRAILKDSETRIPPSECLQKISAWAERWRSPRSPWRLKAERMLPDSTRLSKPMLNACLNLFFRSFRIEALETFLRRFPDEPRELVGHILPANVLAASAESFMAELILGHVNIVKVSSRAPVFPLLVTETLTEIDPRFSRLVTLLCWKGGNHTLDEALIQGVDRFIAFGDEATIKDLHALAPEYVALEMHGPASSIGVIDRKTLTKRKLSRLAWKAAIDVSLYDQRGCLNLQTIFVQRGGEVSAEEFAYALAHAMGEVEKQYPRGELTVPEAAAVRLKRQHWAVKELAGKRVFQKSDPSGSWSVLYESLLSMDEPLAGRVITVRPFLTMHELRELIAGYRESIQAIAVPEMRLGQIWREYGIPYVAEFGSVQAVPVGWQRMGLLQIGHRIPNLVGAR